MSYLAVIPARGGSKRVPRKNVRDLMGMPLIAYTIKAAQLSGLFEMIVVSTDSGEIAEVAEAYGAEVPFLRAPELADEHTPVSEATADALQRIDLAADRFEYVCQLMPNCPLRTAEDIVASHQQFLESDVGAQLSVIRYGWQNPWWAMRRGEDLRLDPLFPEAMHRRSQDLPELFCPTGAIWWARADVLRQEGTYHVPHKTGWEISWQHGLDIDTEDDWMMAEWLIARADPPSPGL